PYGNSKMKCVDGYAGEARRHFFRNACADRRIPERFPLFRHEERGRDGGVALNRRSSRRVIRVRVLGSIRAPSQEKMLKDFNG
ncbi:MAG TPA: hypothetical protein VKV96_14710, partial [Roseiarcus sp.]|nr:hypothetical protein [Roseiarcus sp.]